LHDRAYGTRNIQLLVRMTI